MIEQRTIPCPTAESIRHYAAGGFDDQQAEQLEDHLLNCPHCETMLDELDDPSDAIIRALTTLPMSPDDELAYQELRQSALAQTVDFADAAAAQLQLASRLADPDLGPLPCRLGSYELLACIGRGASGAVYRARHLKLEQTVAVKVLDASRSIDPDSFLREMKTIGSLTHPNIVRATDAGEADGNHFLVMEYVDGIDAARLLFRHGPLGVADACEIARQAALGLQFIHEQSLIHRDVKPSNLLVTVQGQVKLLDLGIATRSDKQHGIENGKARPQGTLDYMAPEAWNDPAAIDARSDLYSLGRTLHKLLTASVPLRHEDLDLTTLAQVPRSVQRLLHSLLAKHPEQRPPSMQQVIDALEPACRGADLPGLIAKTSPQLAALVPENTVSGVRTQRSVFTRRAVIAGAASFGAVAFLLSKLRLSSSISLRRAVWRPLSPVEPKILLSVDTTTTVDVRAVRQDEFEVTSADLALVNMGRPVNGLFAFSVDLTPNDVNQCGIFFRGQFDYSQPNRTLRFHSVELRSASNPTGASPGHYLLWSEWLSKRENGAIDVTQTELATVAVELDQNASAQHLQATVGRQGMPEILWNGQSLHESLWQLSSEGRAVQRMSTGLLPTAYLGWIGVSCANGTAVFRKPRLTYL